jgi:hypothetical protein
MAHAIMLKSEHSNAPCNGANALKHEGLKRE